MIGVVLKELGSSTGVMTVIAIVKCGMFQ